MKKENYKEKEEKQKEQKEMEEEEDEKKYLFTDFLCSKTEVYGKERTCSGHVRLLVSME